MPDDIDVRLRRESASAADVVLRTRSTAAVDSDAAVLYGGRRIPVPDAGLTIGRGNDCTLVLTSGLVSPRHAVIRRREGWYEVSDEDSRTGTYLNGERFVGGRRSL